MSAITRHFTLEEHINCGTATKDEQQERNLLQKLKRAKEGKETFIEKTQRQLLEFLHAD